jgi:predicted PhzF superfamily epimerase YddE/YHI9
MQAIAFEMNQAETAFLTPRAEPNLFGLRWFTPTVEVDLCGHATLASAHILWTTGLVKGHAPIRFETRSEILSAEFESGRIVLDFPSESPDPADLPIDAPFAEGAVFVGQNRMDWFIEYEHASQIRDFQPDFPLIASMGKRGLIVTAPADDGVQDFISRFFAPQSGVPEDPVTGSAHCGLAPYWAHRLGKDELSGYQASQRGGVVGVKVCGDLACL